MADGNRSATALILSGQRRRGKMWKELLENQVLITSVIGWTVAQILKTMIDFALNKSFNAERLTGSGGMPSSHSALVCAAAVSCGMSAGFDSPVFAVAAVVAFIVMYDAAHVRRETGEQAKVLNYILRNWSEVRPEEFERDLKELIGHTPLQVAVGAVLGVAVGLLGSWLAFGF